jgi:hypothetical protein
MVRECSRSSDLGFVPFHEGTYLDLYIRGQGLCKEFCLVASLPTKEDLGFYIPNLGVIGGIWCSFLHGHG